MRKENGKERMHACKRSMNGGVNFLFRLKLNHVAELDKLRQQFIKEMQEITKTQKEEKQQQLATLKKELDAEQVVTIYSAHDDPSPVHFQVEEEARLRRLQKEVLASLQNKLNEEEEDEEACLEEVKQDHLRTARRKVISYFYHLYQSCTLHLHFVYRLLRNKRRS